MSELLRKIYDDVLVYERDVIKTNKKVDQEVTQLVEPYRKQLTDEELEKLNDLLSVAVLSAEQAGFENGVRFAVKMLHSLFDV